MFQRVAFLAPLLLAACAAPRTSALVVGDGREARAATAQPELAAPAAEPVTSAAPAPAPAASRSALLAAEDGSLHESRFTVKGGYWGSDEDTLDDGYIFSASWMRFFTRFFALEFEAGYLDGDGEDGGVDVDVWSIPVFLNGRLNAPLWILDVYGGAGVGGFYYDAEVSAGGLSADDDGFLLGGNVFVGATINLADSLALGLEGKYYLSEDIDDADEGLNGYALMLTLGFGR
ncbi:MAG TPA: outer membrane beta-barrel protein [Planctomycetota bacterium]